jgi:hypothetical protein
MSHAPTNQKVGSSNLSRRANFQRASTTAIDPKRKYASPVFGKSIRPLLSAAAPALVSEKGRMAVKWAAFTLSLTYIPGSKAATQTSIVAAVVAQF